ncbi:MAG: LCP family protein [Actinomycetota bacterium]|nr:LCP family protein [Actinomycetota bacterium]
MPPPPDPESPPEYRLYRSRRNPFARRGRDDGDELARLRGERGPRFGGGRPRIDVGRIARWLAAAVIAWVALSVVVFVLSAQIQQGKIGDAANRTLGGAGYPLTSANTILVLGSDQRSAETAEPGSHTSGPSRADSILLVRVGGGANARLSIARDTLVDIPGAGRQKINAAYAIGGTSLAVRTVEDYTGVDVNHVVIVSFADFPKLIDAMGGITYHGGCVVSLINGGFKNGGYTLRLPAGESHLDGRQALALARTRKNRCHKREDDLTRARRQQKVLAAMRSRLLSPAAFVRLPFISWQGPRTIHTDMSGPTLLGVFAALSVGGNPAPRVLGTENGNVPDSVRRAAVRRFLRG